MAGLADAGFNFDNSYTTLPSALFQKIKATPVTNPDLIVFNDNLAEALGLDTTILKSYGAPYFSGNDFIKDSDPIAQAYAGHQFGGFSILGDGRAILLGEHITSDQQRFDIQLKGAGRTAYSRSGDGRAALGPMLREYLMSEAMHTLGIPTTRSLAVTKTGEMVYRDDAYPGAVLTRVASSHIRVGTFQYAAALADSAVLQSLADYTIKRHFPEIRFEENPYSQLLTQVIQLQASLIAKWMNIGFIHGVMNTDNMSICGETIDYGPCAFMNHYDAATVFSSIDKQGRYAYRNQAPIAHWNLFRFAEALLPLLDDNMDTAAANAEALLDQFPDIFMRNWLSGMREKLGLFNEEADDLKLAEDLLMLMQKNQSDYTNTFRAFATQTITAFPIYQDEAFRQWYILWQKRLSRQTQNMQQSLDLMRQTNPAIIPRNHLVEEAIHDAVEYGNMNTFENLLAAVSNPFQPDQTAEKYLIEPPADFDKTYQTFCGT